MIKGITSSDPYISVGGTNTPQISASTNGIGIIRYNFYNQCIEVTDGAYWQQLNSFQEINLTPRTKEILTWADKKMSEEKERETLAKDHPAIAVAIKNLKLAEEHLELITQLTKNHEIQTTS